MAVSAFKLYVQLLAISRSLEVESGQEPPDPEIIHQQVLEVLNDFNIAWLKASEDEDGKRKVVQIALDIAEKLPVAEGGVIILKANKIGVPPVVVKPKRRQNTLMLFNAVTILRNPRWMILLLTLGMLLYLTYKINKLVPAQQTQPSIEQGE
jgi:hypothetical protein